MDSPNGQPCSEKIKCNFYRINKIYVPQLYGYRCECTTTAVCIPLAVNLPHPQTPAALTCTYCQYYDGEDDVLNIPSRKIHTTYTVHGQDTNTQVYTDKVPGTEK